MKDWFDPRHRASGGWAFLLHRLSGLGLVFYLYLHLAVLNQLRAGPEGWDVFLALARSPLFLLLDGLLLAGVLIHGLNGLRLTLLGLGYGLRWQKPLFWVSLALAVALTVWGTWALFAK
jgi:succinate dehydrogenase / fumarate reductase cytochrome b subunit